MTTLGFLGLGTMGSAMAMRLVAAGHDVIVWNRSPASLGPLVEAGARAARSSKEALSADVSFSMLANDAAADDVLRADAVAASRGRTHVMMASISPSMADLLEVRFSDAGATYLSAPVVGRPDVAAAGQLAILAAGRGEGIDAVEPYLLDMGRRVWRLGEHPSTANAVKAAVNYTIIHALQAMAESVTMTERLGVPPAQFIEVLTHTLFGGVAYEGYGTMIASRNYSPPGFRISLGRKDLGLAQEVAASVGFEPATLPALIDVFEEALADDDLRELDWSAIAEVSRRSRT